MVKCLYGGPEFLLKMIPVRGMKAKFLHEQVQEILNLIKGAGGKPTSIIADGCRVNKKFFKKFKTVDKKPWLTTDGIFLLFDYVHLIKCIRNNWLTEPDSELTFKKDDKSYTAKWDDLINLFEHEEIERKAASGIRGLSKLTEVAIKPKPIERQKVDTCLRIFSEETLHALKTHPKVDQKEVKGTTMFIDEVLKMSKILNVRSKDKAVRRNNPLEEEMSSPDDSRLEYLLDIAKTFKTMGKAKKGELV